MTSSRANLLDSQVIETSEELALNLHSCVPPYLKTAQKNSNGVRVSDQSTC